MQENKYRNAVKKAKLLVKNRNKFFHTQTAKTMSLGMMLGLY